MIGEKIAWLGVVMFCLGNIINGNFHCPLMVSGVTVLFCGIFAMILEK